MGWPYRTLIRPWLFAQDAEAAHNRALAALASASRQPLACGWLQTVFGALSLPVEVFGLKFPNPVGLAAGMDKQAAAVPAWAALGFGFSELGGVTWQGQPGNPAPRMFRAVAENALVNRMGFNNGGAESLARRLGDWKNSGRWPKHPVGINLGKSKATPLTEAAGDYANSFRVLRDLADFFVVNVSSPNTPNLRQLQDKAALDEILAALQEQNTTQKPILVKVSPDLTLTALDEILELVGPRRLAGLVATNTTITRPATANAAAQKIFAETGGLSGRPVRDLSTIVIRHLHRQTKGKLPIIGVGGIFTAADAWEKVTAGASLVQVYSGLVYEGPGLTKSIVSGLEERFRASGAKEWSQVVGSSNPRKGSRAKQRKEPKAKLVKIGPPIPRGNSPFDWLKIIIGAGAGFSTLWTFFSITSNGFYNFFSDSSVIQLAPFLCALSLIVLFIARKLVKDHNKTKFLYFVAIGLVLFIWIIGSFTIHKKNVQARVDGSQRNEEHLIITNLPSRLDGMENAVRDLQAQLEDKQKQGASGSELLSEFQQKIQEGQFGTSESSSGQQIASVLNDMASEHKITVNELGQKILSADKNAEDRRDLIDKLRRASGAETAQWQKQERDAYVDSATAAYAQLNFEKSLDSYQSALKLTDRSEAPQEWASLQIWVGLCHGELGIRVAGAAAAQHLQASVTAYRAALQIYTRVNSPQDWAMTEGNLGVALWSQAGRTEGADSVSLLDEAVEAHRDTLEVWTQASSPQNWANSQNNLGAALSSQAYQSDDTNAAHLLDQAVAAYREALKVRTREALPQDWALTENNLGFALQDEALRDKGLNALQLLRDAVIAFRAALEVRTREVLPQDWALTQCNLGSALRSQAELNDGGDTDRLLDEAVTAYRESLKVQTRETLPQEWAGTENNLGNVLANQSGRSKGRDALRLLKEAVEAFRAALEVRTREEFPQDWAATENNLGLALCNQAWRSEGTEAVRLWGEAIVAYRASLEVYTQEHFPHQHKLVSDNLTKAEETLRKLNP